MPPMLTPTTSLAASWCWRTVRTLDGVTMSGLPELDCTRMRRSARSALVRVSLIAATLSRMGSVRTSPAASSSAVSSTPSPTISFASSVASEVVMALASRSKQPPTASASSGSKRSRSTGTKSPYTI
eukprot:scaffold9084_cov52-Phaeocystis_antarctica.AAC.1